MKGIQFKHLAFLKILKCFVFVVTIAAIFPAESIYCLIDNLTKIIILLNRIKLM